jgi:hypothetical protein
MKRLLFPAAMLIFICTNSLAAPSKHISTNSTNLSSEVSSALALVPSEVKTIHYKVMDETLTENDPEDIQEYDVAMFGKNFKGDALFNTNGTLISYNEYLKDVKLPSQVQDAIKAKYPDAVFTKDRETINKGDNFTDEYNVHFKCDNKHGYAVVNSNGDIIRSKK